MKAINSLLVLAGAVSAHYNFPALIYNGVTNADWQHVRQWTDYYTYDPVTTVLTDDIRCNVNGTVAFAPSILSVAAGSQLGFTVGPDIYHPGPLMAYLGIVPKGSTAANWDASGTAWFKIFEDAPTGYGTSALVWPSNGDTTVTFTIPAETPSGDYLIRVEQIGLHVAESEGGAQFYLSCGQITITNGGNGTPSPLVAFPGAYSPTDPGILIDIYYPVPTNYTPPGPPVWPPTSTGVATSSVVTTPPSTSTVKSTTTPASPTSSSGPTGGCTVAEYGQCGGNTYTGCTTCQSGTTCSAVSPPYYSQCL